MDSQGSCKPEKVSADDEEVQKTPAQEFMESDETEKKATLKRMYRIQDIEKILPEDISTLDKDTTAMVLKKALHMCGVSTNIDVETVDEDVTRQDYIQFQIEQLEHRMAMNASKLKFHREAKEIWNHDVARHNENKQLWEERQQETNDLREQLGDDHPDVLSRQEVLDEAFRNIREDQDELDNREFPLKD